MKDLHTYLFTTTGYNTDVRPASDQSQPTDITLDLTITGLLGIDEVVQKMSTVGFLTLKWTDDFLQWTPATYGGITYVEVPQNKVWKPNVHLSNGFTDFTELGGTFMLLTVDYTGNVTWIPYKVFDTKCSIDIEYFPFDQQKCKIQFVVWSSSINSVRLSVGTQGVALDDLQSNGEWNIIETSSESFTDDNSSFVACYVTLRRKPLIYVLENLLPTVFLSILGVMTFVIPVESGERISYSITIFLSFAIFLTIVSASLPDNSHAIPIFSRFLILQLCIDVLVIIVSSIQIRFRHREETQPVPKLLIKMTKLARILQCRGGCCAKRCTSPEQVSPEELDSKSSEKGNDVIAFKGEMQCENDAVTWKDVVSAIDFFMFILLSLILTLSSIIIFIVLVTKYH
ncbi:hypothetical protein FSP39_015437 [Pinctada imbricata]|uniref:Uncharacterized protein n=1 Tax=Pinctada imbricata TaxID=66713 RepID=A0AA88XWV1_PINIB|nr:hypothetical protein FSP39_015437 [Pinctada imbricata]